MVAVLAAYAKVFGNILSVFCIIGCSVAPVAQHVVVGALLFVGFRLFLYSEIHVVFYVYLSLFGILGGNKDNTVGTAGTVDGCRGCILEHVDAFDIVGWDVINA